MRAMQQRLREQQALESGKPVPIDTDLEWAGIPRDVKIKWGIPVDDCVEAQETAMSTLSQEVAALIADGVRETISR